MAELAGNSARAAEHLTVDPDAKADANREQNIEQDVCAAAGPERHFREGAEIGVIVHEDGQT